MPYREIRDRYLLPKPDAVLFRYFEDYKAEYLFKESELYFTQVSHYPEYDELLFSIADKEAMRKRLKATGKTDWEDIYNKNLANNMAFKNTTFISCWSESKNESRRLWNEYVKGNNGIAIKTSVQKLINEFNVSKEIIYIPKIHYFDPVSGGLGVINTIRMFSRKPNTFSYENEVRCIVQYHTLEVKGDHLTIPINLDSLIDEIIIHPRATPEYHKAIEELAKAKGLDSKIQTSSLDWS